MGKRKNNSEQSELESLFGTGGQEISNTQVSSSVMPEKGAAENVEDWPAPPQSQNRDKDFEAIYEAAETKKAPLPAEAEEPIPKSSYKPPKPERVKIGNRYYLNVTPLIMNENEIAAMQETDMNAKLFASMTHRT